MNQGAFANKAGKRLEAFTADLLEERGYRFVPEKRDFRPDTELKEPIFTTQYEVGKSIYNKKRRVDLILYHPVRHPKCLCIQCKWQAMGGTVDEKYPYEVLCIEQGDFDTIIILDGGGYTPGARQWLLNQAGKGRQKHVFNQGEFYRYASKGGV